MEEESTATELKIEPDAHGMSERTNDDFERLHSLNWVSGQCTTDM